MRQFCENNKIAIRAFRERDLDAVLRLIESSDSTNRTKETWLGNDMTAILAFENEKLVGIIPFERRCVVLNENESLDVLWASGVHVEPGYRGQRIGSRMDGEINKYFSPEFEAIMVCREDERSPAYRWYEKLGYQRLMPIISFKKNLEKVLHAPEYQVWHDRQDLEDYGKGIFECFSSNIGSRGGFCARHALFWREKLDVHYYKNFYAYHMLAIMCDDNVLSYAFLGQTKMKDDIERLDILEMMSPEGMEDKNILYRAIMDFANQLRLKEIRIQIAEKDTDLQWIKSLGFTERWQTNIMGKLIGSDNAFPSIQWRYFHIDYI